jgi:hypothetical protein
VASYQQEHGRLESVGVAAGGRYPEQGMKGVNL